MSFDRDAARSAFKDLYSFLVMVGSIVAAMLFMIWLVQKVGSLVFFVACGFLVLFVMYSISYSTYKRANQRRKTDDS